MSQEIVYTSAPQGLKTGSKGFCTVISTEGITDYFAERLEMLSGYRHAFSPGDPKAPVNYSHLQIKVGRHSYHVLSRVCDAGFDYSQRSNKLAHHVALEASELVPAGPAAVLASRGFCITKWDGKTKMLPQGRLPTAQRAGTGTCLTWKSVAGDAGWAGVLAESAMVSRPKPVSVIFRAGTDTLALVVESMCLLPAQKRWDVSFNTYFTKAVAGSDCLWRFVLDGTKQAEALRAKPTETIIDLAHLSGRASGGHMVDLARSGKQESDPSQAFVLPGNSGKAWPTRSPRPQVAAAAEDANQDFDSYDPYQGIPELPESHRRKKKKLTRVHIGIMIGFGITLAAAGALLAGAWFSGSLAPNRGSQPAPTLQQDDTTVVPDLEEDTQTDETPLDDKGASALEEGRTTDDSVESSFPVKSSGTLPVFDLSETGGAARILLSVTDPAQCEITLLGSRQFFTEQVTLSAVSGSPESARSWNVEVLSRGVEEPAVLGIFQVDEKQLSFNRSAQATEVQCRQLSHCVLRIDDGTEQRYFALGPAVEWPPQSLRLSDNNPDLTLAYDLPEFVTERLGRVMQFDLQLQSAGDGNVVDWPESALAGLTVPSSARITIRDDFAVSTMRMFGKSPLGRSRGIAQKHNRDLAQIDVEIRVIEDSDGTSKRSFVVDLTPAVFLQPIKESERDFARRFIQGDGSLIGEIRSVPWAIQELTSRLSSDVLRTRFIEPVVDEYNTTIGSPDKQVTVGEEALQSVLTGVADYYDNQPVRDRRKSRETLDQLVEIVRQKSEKLSKLERLNEQLSNTQLHVSGYLMLDGQKVTMMTTRVAK